ncbi:hypothetical protein F5Y18DRAFT_135347 [Xylariaceae sp. FL1019]|nr:hypothetical protein F5Y18DRAFT_135347 [Xylariaceae sp. FL1019]
MTSLYSEASLDDVDFATPMSPPLPRRPPFGYPEAHSGFGFPAVRAGHPDESDDNLDDADSSSTGNYSPPAWRRLENGDRWYGNWRGGNDVLGRRHLDKSRDVGPSDRQVFEEARRTRLPDGSMSPEKGRTPEPQSRDEDETLTKMKCESMPPIKEHVGTVVEEDKRHRLIASMPPETARDNYIQQRTEPIDAVLNFSQKAYQRLTHSWWNIAVAILAAIITVPMGRMLVQPAALRPSPDLVKVAGLARSFEPLIYYSENGVSQVGDLQATGVAVWDLGESMRSSNMTSAPIIVKELDELSDSLRTLAMELTRFFANVDGDIDSILIVMDWARRELSQLQAAPSPPLSTAFSNIHNLLCSAGLLENPTTGTPTKLGTVATAVFGTSQTQHTRQTLQRTFTEFLSVLEEAVENELQHSLALFGLFESIDRQFLNLARTVIREANVQEEQHGELLSSLWTRILGPRASEIKKFERNHELLANVREKTVRNKGILVEHNGKLQTLKANLESLRRKLVSPLVRSVNSSTITLDEQIKGLEDVGFYLEGVRARQKEKLMEILYGGGSKRAGIAATTSARLVGEGERSSY